MGLRHQERELLNTSYFHVVFTIPHELNVLALENPRLFYDLLFTATAQTLLQIASDPKHLGAEIGVIAILHTWGQNLLLHPHIHCVIPAGGLSPDHHQWVAGYLVYFALGAAILTFIITHNVRSTISVVIVAGACGIAAGTPLAILGAIGRAAHQGAIIKGGLYLEALAAVDTVLLDKTGTLTFGTPRIREVVSANGFDEQEIIAAAGIAERKSEHPLAKAVVARANELGISLVDPDTFSYTPGRGVRVSYRGEEIVVGSLALLLEERMTRGLPANSDAGGASEVYVARSGQVLGSIRIADVLRPEAKNAIAALRRMGLKTVLLSGDTQAATSSVGQGLGVHEAVGGLLPEQKARWVTDLRKKGRNVAMVGDGINDAPALVEASVGIAMGSGTEVARESADVILIGSDLSKLVETLRIAHRCRAIIMQNFVGTLIVDSLGVGMAAFGLLNPLLAAFIHVTSELAFILNSTRLLPRSSESKQ